MGRDETPARERARDYRRYYPLRKRRLDEIAVSTPEEEDSPAVHYVRGELLVAGRDLGRSADVLEEFADELEEGGRRWDLVGGDEQEREGPRTRRYRLRDGVDAHDIARRIRFRGNEQGTEDLAVGPHHILTPAQQPKIGPGSDPWPAEQPWPPGPPVDPERSAAVAVVDSGQWEAAIAGALAEPGFDVDPIDVEQPFDLIDYAGGGHGGFIAGVIRSRTDGGVKIKAFRAYDDTLSIPALTEEAVIAKVDQALEDSDVAVVNLSLGTYEDLRDGGRITALRDAVHRWHLDGKLIVAAAGNDHRREPWYPAAFADEGFGDCIVSVGALESRSRRHSATPMAAASFSNHGPWVTAWAPGVGVVSNYPEIDFEYRAGDVEHFDGLAHWDGTSFAAPFVAAELVRMAAADPEVATPRDAWVKIRGDSPFVIFWPDEQDHPINADPPAADYRSRRHG